MLQAVDDLIIVVGRDKRVLYANHPPSASFPTRALPEYLADYVPKRAAAVLSPMLDRVMATGKEELLDLPWSPGDGQGKWYRTKFFPVVEQSETVAVIGIVTDITVLQNRYTQVQANYNAMLGAEQLRIKLIRMAAQELEDSLGRLRNTLRIQQMFFANAEQRAFESGNDLQIHLVHLETLVRDLAEFGRIEAEKFK
jgi:signal transduction histidine kinase